MANVRGGDITQLLINGREMDPVAEANVTYRLAGFTNENMPTGNGGLHTRKLRKLGGFDALPLSVDPERGDVEFIQAIANEGEPVPVQMTLAGGQTYSGDLSIEGEVDPNTGDGQLEVSMLGQRFEKI